MNLKKLGIYSLLSVMAIQLVSAVDTVTWQSAFGDAWWSTILNLLFGPLAAVTPLVTSNAVITVAVWLLIFVTFGDIISTFSTFREWVSWTTAFLIGVIAANLGAAAGTIAFFTGLFAALGAIAVYVGLGAAFFAFIAVNLGLRGWKRWIIRRRAMMEAATSEAGGDKLAGTIKGLGKVGKALSKI